MTDRFGIALQLNPPMGDIAGNPRSPMIVDPDRNLFGVTPEGDAGGGVVFDLTP
jgi:hypothetical protein